MAETRYQAGDAVRVFDGPFWRQQLLVGTAPASASRPATIVRQMPDATDYQVEFTDGQQPAEAFVDAQVLLPA
jgi:hypothetical protein